MSALAEIIGVDRGADRVLVIPVLQDNFVYLVCRGTDAVAIDAGAFAPVERCLLQHDLHLRSALLTHQHADHSAGFARLQHLVAGAGQMLPWTIETLALPGHTGADVGYYFPVPGVVFTGDCLINGACGRVLGGSAEELYRSLQRIKQLPSDTLVMGGHDYLQDNLRFGLVCEPGNVAITARLQRYAQDPAAALFVTLAEEMASNPFLRAPDVSAFVALRAAKDRF